MMHPSTSKHGHQSTQWFINHQRDQRVLLHVASALANSTNEAKALFVWMRCCPRTHRYLTGPSMWFAAGVPKTGDASLGHEHVHRTQNTVPTQTHAAASINSGTRKCTHARSSCMCTFLAMACTALTPEATLPQNATQGTTRICIYAFYTRYHRATPILQPLLALPYVSALVPAPVHTPQCLPHPHRARSVSAVHLEGTEPRRTCSCACQRL